MFGMRGKYDSSELHSQRWSSLPVSGNSLGYDDIYLIPISGVFISYLCIAAPDR